MFYVLDVTLLGMLLLCIVPACSSTARRSYNMLEQNPTLYRDEKVRRRANLLRSSQNNVRKQRQQENKSLLPVTKANANCIRMSSVLWTELCDEHTFETERDVRPSAAHFVQHIKINLSNSRTKLSRDCTPETCGTCTLTVKLICDTIDDRFDFLFINCQSWTRRVSCPTFAATVDVDSGPIAIL
ncbi:hypothetical protein OUZ56_022112 [Daphnia magna]|uniref:Uncharacterized protein n=1 Tax=Daphnia magna TaxID=35525 RepID=A0ABR0AVZ6_9CRUS|nr:hypothetical protein OUZ56_022112 [Daphnia magna]